MIESADPPWRNRFSSRPTFPFVTTAPSSAPSSHPIFPLFPNPKILLSSHPLTRHSIALLFSSPSLISRYPSRFPFSQGSSHSRPSTGFPILLCHHLKLGCGPISWSEVRKCLSVVQNTETMTDLWFWGLNRFLKRVAAGNSASQVTISIEISSTVNIMGPCRVFQPFSLLVYCRKRIVISHEGKSIADQPHDLSELFK